MKGVPKWDVPNMYEARETEQWGSPNLPLAL